MIFSTKIHCLCVLVIPDHLLTCKASEVSGVVRDTDWVRSVYITRCDNLYNFQKLDRTKNVHCNDLQEAILFKSFYRCAFCSQFAKQRCPVIYGLTSKATRMSDCTLRPLFTEQHAFPWDGKKFEFFYIDFQLLNYM